METLGDLHQQMIYQAIPNEGVVQDSGVKTRSKVTYKLDAKVEASNAQLAYAEITEHSIKKILDIFKNEGSMSNQSVFMDVGSGLGKVVFFAAMHHQLKSVGLEIVKNRHDFAL